MKYFSLLLTVILLNSAMSCNTTRSGNVQESAKEEKVSHEKPSQERLASLSKAYFAAGCFWCVEAIFESVRGVEEVVSGYAGGSKKDANYKAVSAGVTDHAEAVEIYYDPAVIDYRTLLTVLFGSHDPTTLNRQGPDSGRQYRSSIFYQNEEERQVAETIIKELDAQKIYSKKIVTEVVPFDAFYPAEDYHQDYERLNPNQPYVKGVSIPRLNRFKAKYPELLKEGEHLDH